MQNDYSAIIETVKETMTISIEWGAGHEDLKWKESGHGDLKQM